MDAIRTVRLTKRYKELVALDGLDLTVKKGELFSLLGVNGAGKTTAIRLLTCLSAPTQGEAFVCGHSVTREQEAVKRLIGVSPQETAVAPNLSVKENLEFLCGVYGLSACERARTVDSLVERFGLASVLKRRAGKLSGGFQRRVSIAMALVGTPEVLFLDEPTLALDVLARRELWDVIRSLKGKTTVVLTTHYMEEAEALSDRVGILRDGCLLAVGTTEELKRQTGEEAFENAFVSIAKEGRI
ncbi:MAG: ABC transporter ATP-binding protein [Clostridia bacterium]|nr:ABC transporter ATP-binding protein [Clostridia bacterium]